MREHVYKQIQGWHNATGLYARMVREAADGAHFVEVGAWKGQSTAHMAVEIANSGKQIQFDVIDNFTGDADPRIMRQMPTDKPLLYYFMENMLRFDMLRYVRPIPVASPQAAMLYDDASLDFVFIDGSHLYEAVRSDIEAWLPKVKPGGLLAGDDCQEHEVRHAVMDSLGMDAYLLAEHVWSTTPGRQLEWA